MNRAAAPVVGQPLQEIGNVDQDRASLWEGRLELACMKWIDFQSAHLILEEKRAQPKVRVGNYSGMTFLLNDLSFDGRVVNKTKLWVGLLGDVVEEIVAQVHGHRQTFQDIECKCETLGIEVVQSLLKSRQVTRRGALRIAKAPMLIALLVIYSTVRLIPIGCIALIDFRIFKPPCKLSLYGKIEE